MPLFNLLQLELSRLLRRGIFFWWQLIALGIANVIFVVFYQFPLHLGASAYSFAQLISLVNMLLLPLFVIPDLQLDERKGRDWSWLWMPVELPVWVAARVLAWLSLQVLALLMWLVWLWVASYWFFNDTGLMLGSVMQMSLSALWTILLSIALRAKVKQPWLALMMTYVIQVVFLTLHIFSALMLERLPWLARQLESLSYHYRMMNWQRGIASLADILFWAVLCYVLWAITMRSLRQMAAYSPQPLGWRKKVRLVVGILGVVGFLWLPLEFDMTSHRLYQPSAAAIAALEQVEQPFEIERLISEPYRQLGYERWLMRRIWQYQRINRWISANKVIVEREQAQTLGLQVITQLQTKEQFAGLFVRYRELGTPVSVLRTIEQLDEAIVLAARRLKQVAMPRVLLIIDEAQLQSDFSLLASTLSGEFLIDWLPGSMLEYLPFVAADLYVVIGGTDLDASHWSYLEQERLVGRGLWINAMGVRISSSQDYPPLRFEKLALDDYLTEKGLRVGRNLLLDPDGYFMESGAGFNNYPLWLSGRIVEGSDLALALAGLAPLMSVELAYDDRALWQPVVMSSSLAREQSGLLEFSFFELWNSAWEDGASRMLMGEYTGDEGGSLVVVGSTTWLSDMVKDAQTQMNMQKVSALARYISGDKLLMEGQSRFNIITQMRRPFAMREMIGRYLKGLVGVALSWLGSCVILLVLAYTMERREIK